MPSRRRRQSPEPPSVQEGSSTATNPQLGHAVPVEGLQTVTQATMKPALEASLEQFVQELRKELREADKAVQALRTEVAELRSRYETHTHPYQMIRSVAGGMWYDLGMLKTYVKQKETIHDAYGAYLGKPGTEPMETPMTGPPGV